MPYLNVKISAAPSQETTQRVVAFLNEHTHAVLGKRVEVTSIAVEYVAPEHWAIGGKTMAELGQTCFFLDIKITDGTNTKAEKADYVKKVYGEFESLFGNIHPISYIVVDDVRADAWGFTGETQEFRFIKGRML